MSGKGGARNFTKTFIDPGILMQALGQHPDLLQEFGVYDHVSRQQGTDPKGLMQVLPLVRTLVKVSPKAEIHSQPLRQTLLKMVCEKPSLNNSRWNGTIWSNLRAERIGVVLHHIRRLKSPDEMRKCGAKLTAAELLQLQQVVDQMGDKDLEPPPETRRKLKKEVSAVSYDSDGYPKELKTPEEKKIRNNQQMATDTEALSKGQGPESSSPLVSSFRKRKGTRVTNETWCAQQSKGLAQAMGFTHGQKNTLAKGKRQKVGANKKSKASETKQVLKRPATGKSCPKKPAASNSDGSLPWLKLSVITGRKPARQYILGTKDDKPPRLIVEVSEKRTKNYKQVIQVLLDRIKRNNLSKEEALELRRNNKGRPGGSGTVSHARRIYYQERQAARAAAKKLQEQQEKEEEEKRAQEKEEEEKKAQEAEEKKKQRAKEAEEEKKRRAQEAEEEKKRRAQEAEEEKKRRAQEKEEKKRAKEEAQRRQKEVQARKAEREERLSKEVVSKARKMAEEEDRRKAELERILDKRNQELQKEMEEKKKNKMEREKELEEEKESSADFSRSSSEEMDSRDAREKMTSSGQSPALVFGPTPAEAAKIPVAPKARPGRNLDKRSASPGRNLDKRSASTGRNLDKRSASSTEPAAAEPAASSKQVCVDFHNTLEVRGQISKRAIAGLDALRKAGYEVHLLSFCGSWRWKDVCEDASSAWPHWKSKTRTLDSGLKELPRGLFTAVSFRLKLWPSSMAPKKVLKAMKKPALAKGKPKAKASSSTEKPKGILKPKRAMKSSLLKGMAKAAAKKKSPQLTPNKLKSLGKLSLKDKVNKLAEECGTAEETALALQETLSQPERGSIWSKHQVALKGNKEQQEAHNELSKKQKGLASLLWFVENQSPKFMNVSATFGSKETLLKGEEWKTELQMIQQFGSSEFEAHIASGRIQWRSDPWTAGVFNYRDLGDQKKTTEITRATKHTWGQEMQATPEQEEQFYGYWGKGGQQHMSEAEVHFSGKGGKGNALAKGSGKGKKGKGKGPAQLAITNGEEQEQENKDDEKDEKAKWNQCLSKAQKAKDNGILAISNMEEAIASCQRSGRLTKQTRKDYEQTMKDVQVQVEKLKKLLAKKGAAYTLENGKDLISQATATTKQLKDDTKECNQLANKAGSKAASSKK
eukprot:Skav211502  [mRNA]  locus=scaffold2188:899918:906060:- [translate_table: standard]